MLTKTIDIHTPHISLDDVISLIRQGTEIIMTDANTHLARIIPYFPLRQERRGELHSGAMIANADFDDPLPDEFWTGSL